MSHGGPHPGSSASYIIICSGRIAVKVARTLEEKINAVSQCAAQLSDYLCVRYKATLDVADLIPVQTAQHELMEMLDERKLDSNLVEATIANLFDQFEVLEEKYDSGRGSYLTSGR